MNSTLCHRHRISSQLLSFHALVEFPPITSFLACSSLFHRSSLLSFQSLEDTHPQGGRRQKRSRPARSCLPLFIPLLYLWLIVPSCPAQSASPPATAPPSFDQIHRLTEQGKFDEALAALSELSKAAPPPKNLNHEFGLAYYRKGDYPNAANYLKQAIAENPADAEAVQLTGLSLYLAGKPADAIPYLEKVQSWYPSANVDAAYILGVAYMQSKRYADARTAFAKMFSVPPDSAAAYLFTARLLLRFDFGPVAEEYGRKAMELDPKLPLAHQLLGELYLYQSKIPEAASEFEQELKLNPGNPVAYYKLADADSRIQKFDEAERLLQRSIWLDSTSTGPYILLGKVLLKKGETQLAIRSLQRAIAMDPNNNIPHHLLGQAYRDLGRSEDAERELKLAEQLQSKQDSRP